MKKRYLSFILTGLILTSLTACSGSSGSATGTETTQTEALMPVDEVSESQKPEAPPEGQEPPRGVNEQAGSGDPGGTPGGPGGPGGAGAVAEPYVPVELAVTSDAIEAIMNSYSGKEFKAGEVPDEVIETILQTGQKAPSAVNQQPWHFTVVRNPELAGQLASRNYQVGGVVIVVSGKTNESVGVSVAFDCALATQNMYIAAQSLGYGAHLYYGGVDEINSDMKDTLGIPEEYDAQIIMLVGQISEDLDSLSSASSREMIEDNVNYVD